MKKIIKGVTWLKILTLSIMTQVRYIMVSARDCLGVALRAKPNQNRVRGSQPLTCASKVNSLGRCCTNFAPKTIIYCIKTKGRGVILDGYHPRRAAKQKLVPCSV